jgi:hypothetical protein
MPEEPISTMPVNENPTEVPVSEVSTPEATAPVSEPNIQQAAYSLFGSIGYNNPADIPYFIDKMQPRDALFIIVSAAKFGFMKQISCSMASYLQTLTSLNK